MCVVAVCVVFVRGQTRFRVAVRGASAKVLGGGEGVWSGGGGNTATCVTLDPLAVCNTTFMVVNQENCKA